MQPWYQMRLYSFIRYVGVLNKKDKFWLFDDLKFEPLLNVEIYPFTRRHYFLFIQSLCRTHISSPNVPRTRFFNYKTKSVILIYMCHDSNNKALNREQFMIIKGWVKVVGCFVCWNVVLRMRYAFLIIS